MTCVNKYNVQKRFGLSGFVILCQAVVSLFGGCSPATSTRIGPPVPPKQEGCSIDILDVGAVPDKPYRDVGVVHLKNCQSYKSGPCREWLIKEACKLGGDVAYNEVNNMNDGRPDNTAGAITYQITIGTYIKNLNTDTLKVTPAGSEHEQEKGCEAPVESEKQETPEGMQCTE